MDSEKRVFLMALMALPLLPTSICLAQEEEPEEEEPAQARPRPDRFARPASRAAVQAQRDIRSSLSSMGFRVSSVRSLGANRWAVSVVGWDPFDAQPAMKGAISWDPTDRTGRRGRGTLVVETGRSGELAIQGRSLRSLGLRGNAAQLRGKVQLR
ncbi:MAG: hypothetical protein ABW153_20605 [Sedimenticola sp.]